MTEVINTFELKTPLISRRRIHKKNLAMLACCIVSAPLHAATFIGTNDNDVLSGLRGDDLLIGDFSTDGAGFPDIYLPCIAGAGVDFNPSVSGVNGLTADSQNDRFDAGRGNDVVIGEAFAPQFGAFQLNALSGTSGHFGGGGGSNNTSKCFSDIADLGRGANVFIGDIRYEFGPDDVELNAAAGSAGFGRFSFHQHGPGGNGGDNNLTEAFNDQMNDESRLDGPQLLVGDANGQGPSGSEDRLIASAGSGGETGVSGEAGGNGGHLNTVRAFNDLLVGGDEGDQIIGDDLREGGIGRVRLISSAGAGGQGSNGGTGGLNNTVDAFSDTLLGARGGDYIVGDALLTAGDPGDEIEFEIFAGSTPSGGGAGGVGNTINAHNDTIRGGRGSDLLIGDATNTSNSENIQIRLSGSPGNTVNAFKDNISGEQGNDAIHGDFRFTGMVCEIDAFQLIGAFSGQLSLFSDVILAGRGDDLIHGGFGVDTMTGDRGVDVYVYYESDLRDLGGGIPVDVITDFPFRDEDILDMRPLLTCLGFDPGDPINDWLRVSGTMIEIDTGGAGSAFSPMISMPGLPAATTIDSLFLAGRLLHP